MLKKLENFITSAAFEKAEQLFKNNSFEEFSEEMLYVTYKNSSITNYSFINYLLTKKNQVIYMTLHLIY
ncbi:TPA: hypothetical protein ACSVZR_005521 [Bacillus cereus]|uniref:hypothetical protein n=1 Tax=Bacillus sp. ABP14 TaxID=1892404 RepID=UPI000AEF3C4E|nr:hypothetical protein [Bacillus sp. ABP14]